MPVENCMEGSSPENAINLLRRLEQVFGNTSREIRKIFRVVETKISANQNMKFPGKNGKRLKGQKGQGYK